MHLINIANTCIRSLQSTFTVRCWSSRQPLVLARQRRPPRTAACARPRRPTLRKARMGTGKDQTSVLDAPANIAAGKHHTAQPGARPPQQQEQKRRLPGQLQTNLEQQQKQARKKQRRHTPETQLRWDIHQAAKNNDPLAALASYDRGAAEGLKLDMDLHKTLLFLCSGGQKWDDKVPASVSTPPAAHANGTAPAAAAGQGSQPAEAAEHPTAAAVAAAQAQKNGARLGAEAGEAERAEAAGAADSRRVANGQATTSGRERLSQVQGSGAPEAQAGGAMTDQDWVYVSKRGREIWQALDAKGTARSEVVYTALARMAATAGEPDQALQAARDALAAGVQPRLRSFVPALRTYCAAGNFAGAFEVDRLIAEQKLDLTEDEYALLLGVCAAEGARWEAAAQLLARMSRELTALQPATLAAAEALFRSDVARQGLPPEAPGARGWRVERCSVSADGRPSCCAGQLQALDLSPDEYRAFGEGVVALAHGRAKNPGEFEAYQAFLKRHGPHTCLIDGANVALFGQNWENGDTGERGGFSFAQIGAVLEQVHLERPQLKPLLVLHQSRVKPNLVEREAGAGALLERLRREGSFYAAPHGSNDDWYWLHAAVRGGPDALVVSCDEMRDHLFQMLAPKYFAKWKQRHQVHYRFRGDGRAELSYPAAFTVCTQRLEGSGAWMFPAADSREWLCAHPV